VSSLACLCRVRDLQMTSELTGSLCCVKDLQMNSELTGISSAGAKILSAQ